MRRTASFLRPKLVMRDLSAPLSRLAVLPGCLLLSALVLPAALAQKPMPRELQPQNGTFGTCIHPEELYPNADLSSPPLAQIQPGRELVVVEKNGKWVRVFANTDKPDDRGSDQPEFGDQNQAHPISGWMIDKGIVTSKTPDGDLILFGAADAMEQQASLSNPLPNSAEEARLLYKRVVIMFPHSRWTPQAMYRAADIRWQLQKADASSLPSAHERQSYMREQMDENEMRAVMKYFPNSKWADLAAFDMIDNQLCGDWQGSEKCPEKESDLYLKYANDYPNSPTTAEALYDALWRQAAAADMWAEDGNGKRAVEDRTRAHAILASMQQHFPDSSFTARAASVVYKVDQGIMVYGANRE